MSTLVGYYYQCAYTYTSPFVYSCGDSWPLCVESERIREGAMSLRSRRHSTVKKRKKKKIKTRANIRVLLLLFDRPDSLSAGGFEK